MTKAWERGKIAAHITNYSLYHLLSLHLVLGFFPFFHMLQLELKNQGLLAQY